jgi:glycosyltransferase involved in cell wall biosynthesis
MIGHAVSAAARVITVSRASERDIVRFFPKAARRIAVIPNGVEEVFHPAPAGEAAARVGARLGFSGDYLLFVGNPKGHKNLDLLLRGFVKLARLFPELRLVAAGGEERQRRELARTAERLGIGARTHFIAPVSREALADLYDAATVFVFPSLYEGFGLPPLEAMACGAPVAASSSASIPEVLGPAARYFSPESVDSLVGTVVGLLEDPALRKRLSSLGRERARDFTWEEAARHTLAVYREALEQ